MVLTKKAIVTLLGTIKKNHRHPAEPGTTSPEGTYGKFYSLRLHYVVPVEYVSRRLTALDGTQTYMARVTSSVRRRAGSTSKSSLGERRSPRSARRNLVNFVVLFLFTQGEEV